METLELNLMQAIKNNDDFMIEYYIELLTNLREGANDLC